jgi:hypothetical protein
VRCGPPGRDAKGQAATPRSNAFTPVPWSPHNSMSIGEHPHSDHAGANPGEVIYDCKTMTAMLVVWTLIRTN